FLSGRAAIGEAAADFREVWGPHRCSRMRRSSRMFMPVNIIPELLSRRAVQVSAALDGYLRRAEALPARLAEAMRYSIEAGGKRVRPALVLECCVLCGGRDEDALAAAAAI